MAHRPSTKSAKIAQKAGIKRLAPKAATPRRTATKSRSRKLAKPALLAGGNPQIPKAYGDAWVKQASQLPGERL